MIFLIALVLALITPVRVSTGGVAFVDLYGAQRLERAATACWEPSGETLLYLDTSVDLDTIAHELVHVIDCQDDGTLNGSPAPLRPDVRPDNTSDYCWDSPIEWAACSLVTR